MSGWYREDEVVNLYSVALAEWCRLYGHTDNPAWVLYDLIARDLTRGVNPPTMEV